MVSEKSGVGYGKTADGREFTFRISIKGGCVVVKKIEGTSGLGKTAGAEATVPKRMDDFRIIPVFNILHADNTASKPQFAVTGLIYLIIGVIALGVTLVVPAAGQFPDSMVIAQFQKERVSNRGPNITVGVCVKGADVAFRAFLVLACSYV